MNCKVVQCPGELKGAKLHSKTFTFKTFALLLTVVLCGSIGARAQDADPEKPPTPPPPPVESGGDFAGVNPDAKKIPQGVIIVKGAVPSASDSSTPVPESGSVTENLYSNPYFGLTFPLPADWYQKYAGPPPSDSGRYVLTQLEPTRAFKGPARGTILITAQDLFFGYIPAKNALEMVNAKRSHLSNDYRMERQPTEVSIAGRQFYRMDYMSPVAELHWYTLTTQVRCHTVEFMLTSRDTQLLESIVRSMDKLRVSEENAPVCVRNFATGDNVIQRVEPVLTEHKYSQIPVRIIVDRYGKVKHIHIISSFPAEAKAITDALMQWEFRPYKQNGQAVEVETGIMFGRAAMPTRTATNARD